LSTAPPALKLGFAGTPDFAVPALRRLAAEHAICAVFTQPDRPAGRGQALQLSPVKRCALELALPVHQPPAFKTPEALQLLQAQNLDVLIVAAYGLILPAAALALPRLGCFNIHASLLPRWRGAAPIQRALLAGDSTTGITIMRMEQGLDTGPMLASRATEIQRSDTAKTLHERLAILGAQLMSETLKVIIAGKSQESPQPAQGVTYAAKISKAEARIDWSLDAAQILRQVRAFNPWPIAETSLHGQQLRIWDAECLDSYSPHAMAAPGTVVAAGDEGIDVACGKDALRVLRLQLAGRKPLVAQEFLTGQRLLGTRLAQP
jgi:methionyl-tRNA formyltransferase